MNDDGLLSLTKILRTPTYIYIIHSKYPYYKRDTWYFFFFFFSFFFQGKIENRENYRERNKKRVWHSRDYKGNISLVSRLTDCPFVSWRIHKEVCVCTVLEASLKDIRIRYICVVGGRGLLDYYRVGCSTFLNYKKHTYPSLGPSCASRRLFVSQRLRLSTESTAESRCLHSS